jgi:hypothetical protein
MREAYLSGCDLQIGSTPVGASDAHLPHWESAAIILGTVASLITVGEVFIRVYKSVRR